MEYQINEILSRSTLPWWEWNIKENKVSFNKLKVTMLGYDESDFIDCQYQRFTALLHPDDYQKTMDAMYAILRGEIDLYQIDYRIRDINGNFHWYIDRGYVLEKDQNNNPEILRGIVLNAGLEHDKEKIEIILSTLNSITEKNYLVVCANCKRIKVNNGNWEKINEDSIKLLSNRITHGICKECMKVLYPEYSQENERA